MLKVDVKVYANFSVFFAEYTKKALSLVISVTKNTCNINKVQFVCTFLYIESRMVWLKRSCVTVLLNQFLILCIVDTDLYLTVSLAGDKRCNLKRTVTSESISLSKKPEHCFAQLVLPKMVFSSDLIIVIALITDSDLLYHCKQLQHGLLSFYNLTD